MKKEQAKPACEPADYSAFKDKYVKIVSGADRIEYSARVIDLYHDKITLNLADGTEKILSLGYIHSIYSIEKPSDFKMTAKKGTKRKKEKKKDTLNFPEIEKKTEENEDEDKEKDDDKDNLEERVSDDE